MKTFKPKLGAMLMALTLAGCAAPELHKPELAVPTAYKEAALQGAWKQAQPAEAQARGEWWKAFGDPQLDKLIDEAGAANAGLAGAAARLKQARALAGIAEAARVPAVGVQVGGERAKAAAGAAPATVWQSRLSASYEVDLFGRIGGEVSAARADAGAAAAVLRSVQLALQADVAQTYFLLRAADAELALLRETVRLRAENVRISQRRVELGDLGELDLARAQTELAAVRAEASALERERAQREHALAVLLGRPAAAFQLDPRPLPATLALPQVPAGLPSALLERRADVAAAEQAMIAANARIGAAKAARFPLLRLGAAGGGDGAVLADAFRWSSRSWVADALLSLPLIDGGRNRANIARSEAVLEESGAAYRQTVLGAFAEVEDGLAGLRTLADQAQAVDDALAASRRSFDLAGKLYAAGRSGYLDQLDAQRNLVAAERGAVQLRGARAVATVSLIRALGGGW
jgi:multidrug efflux system outer membrane protein